MSNSIRVRFDLSLRRLHLGNLLTVRFNSLFTLKRSGVMVLNFGGYGFR
ncbi:MAG: hypothetical protein ACTS4W_00515 [Candidatus Hodgkinia cicadicola]